MEERLLKNRTILIYGQIDMDVAMDVTRRLFGHGCRITRRNPHLYQFTRRSCGIGRHHLDMIRLVKSPVK